MSNTTVRLGGLTAALALAMTSPLAAAGTLTLNPAIGEPDRGSQDVPQSQTAAAPAVAPPTTALPLLGLPTISVATVSQGYAAQDLLVDLAPDLVSRDFEVIIERQDGEAWVQVTSVTTSGAGDRAVLEALPVGTYRVVVPKQYGLAEHTSEPFAHEPRLLSVSLGFDRASTTTTVNIDPDPAAGGYDFTLEKKGGSGWEFVSNRTTSEADASLSFSDLPTGTYRVVVPDQANAVGAVSQEVDVVSSADLRAATERAAAARAAQSSSGTSSRSTASSGAGAVAGGGNYGGVVGAAMAQVGSAYRLGASGGGAFDCSGLTSFAYRSVGVSLPHNANAQYAATRRVSTPQPGDLVFFLNGASHVGIYIGNGKIVHAANPSRGVEVSSFTSGWYANAFTGFGRP